MGIVRRGGTRKQKIKTAFQFARNIKTTGAISETSHLVEIEMCSRIQKSNSRIVEFGLGHGNITREILYTIDQDSTLNSFEVNNKFIEYVKADINDKRLRIHHADACEAKQYVDDQVDNIICSIPLSMLKASKREEVFYQSKELLKADGILSIVQYSKRILSELQVHFKHIDINKVKNFPTAYIFHCYNTQLS